MKKMRNQIVVLSAFFALAMMGCQRMVEEDYASKAEVVFNVSTGYTVPSTRTTFSGEVTGVGETFERIDWVDGDKFKVYCGAVSSPSTKLAEYTVKNHSSDAVSSTAGVWTNTAFRWGEGEHVFYALYPGSATLTENVAGGTVLDALQYKTDNTGKVKKNADTGFFYTDMSYAFMYAVTKANPGVSQVPLLFRPLMTAFEFTLNSHADEFSSVSSSNSLTKVTLKSTQTNGSYLAGKFSATLNADGTFAIASSDVTSGSNQIDVTIPSGVVSLTPDNDVKITLLGLAMPQTDLSLVLTFGSGTTAFTRTLDLNDVNGNPITVNPGEKLYMHPSGVSGQWTYTLNALQAATVTYSGISGQQISSSTAYKSFATQGAIKKAVPFKFQYSATGEDGTWSDDAPEWISPAWTEGLTENGYFNGNISETNRVLTLTLEPRENSETALAADPHHVELAKASRKQTDFDLSLVDVSTFNWTGGTPGTVRRTANCYVVQGSGTYKFPLVYGNGVDWTKNTTTGINEDAYRAKAGQYRPDDGEKNYLGSFKDHLDANIYNGGNETSSPYLTTHLGKQREDFTAALLWTDASGLVTNVSMEGSGEDTYIKFDVPEATICQGNALIAALVDADGDGTQEVAWSWHIWVTDEDLTATKEGSNGYYFAPVDIGWCDEKAEIYEARSCHVKAVQVDYQGNTIGLESASVLVSQTAGSVTYGGNSPYYQWGRKDPMAASTGTGATDKTRYPFSAIMKKLSGAKAIGYAIQHPNEMNYLSSKNWCSTNYYNAWNSVLNGAGDGQYATEVTKTIYDPSPVGYKMPPQAAFASFTTANCLWDAGVKGRYYDVNGNGAFDEGELIFYAMGFRAHGSGNLANLGTSLYYWTAVPTSTTNGYYLYGLSSDVKINNSYRSYAFPVRPVKE